MIKLLPLTNIYTLLLKAPFYRTRLYLAYFTPDKGKLIFLEYVWSGFDFSLQTSETAPCSHVHRLSHDATSWRVRCLHCRYVRFDKEGKKCSCLIWALSCCKSPIIFPALSLRLVSVFAQVFYTSLCRSRKQKSGLEKGDVKNEWLHLPLSTYPCFRNVLTASPHAKIFHQPREERLQWCAGSSGCPSLR